MLDEGVRAEVKVGGEYLRLFSEHSALGVQASVYNANTKTWIAPSEPVDDIETGKDRAAAYGYGLPAARSERGLASLFRVSAPNNYWVSSRTSVNFRKSRSNEATGMFSAAAVAAIRQSTKWTFVFP